jgi:tetratricopeptide (TPR) repeat protein
MSSPADAWAKAASAAFSAGNDVLALQHALHGLSLDPKHRDARFNAAVSYQRQGHLNEALAFYRQLVVDGQDDAGVLRNLVQLQLDQNLHAVALGTLAVAMSLYGADARLHFLRGVALGGLQRSDEALDAFSQAIAFDPSFAEAHNNLGLLLEERSLMRDAFDAFSEAIQQRPSFAPPFFNLGSLLLSADLLTQAQYFFRRALELQPSYSVAAFNLGLACLKAGDFAQGWQFYEQRFLLDPKPIMPNVIPAGPRLNESAVFPPALLVVSEQGLGDTLQFIRYVPLLAARWPATRLIVAVQRPVLEICRQALPGFVVVGDTTELPLDPQFPWIPLLSLPLLLGLSTAVELEVPMPYLSVPESRVDAWASKIRQASGFKLALHWQGNLHAERFNLAGRSLPLETLAPLMALPGLTLVSIQKGEAADQRLGCSFADRFIECQDAIDATWDFLDISAILRCCDLLITTDTAAAHLAGGLGVPTWLLLHRPSDWRWGQHPEQTHWYPSMRLFRQPAPGRWDTVVASLVEQLSRRLASSALPSFDL